MSDPIRVAVIDNSPNQGNYIAKQLRGLGHEVNLFPHGEAALLSIKALPPERVPEVFACRDSLPGQSGPELIEQARRIPGLQNAQFVSYSLLPKSNIEAVVARIDTSVFEAEKIRKQAIQEEKEKSRKLYDESMERLLSQ